MNCCHSSGSSSSIQALPASVERLKAWRRLLGVSRAAIRQSVGTMAQVPRFNGHTTAIVDKGSVEAKAGHVLRQPAAELSKITLGFIFPRLQTE